MAYLIRLILHPFPHSLTPSPPFSVRIKTMSDPWGQLWSNNSDVPQLSEYEYVEKKAMLAGNFIGSILYGIPTHVHVFVQSSR